jgi:hypothetical protein
VTLSNTVYLFTRFGLGEGPADLQLMLVVKFLGLVESSGEVPAKILFYTQGVRLACKESPVVDTLKKLAVAGTELILCKTCLDYFNLQDQVEVGVVGGMPDIITALHAAEKVISL